MTQTGRRRWSGGVKREREMIRRTEVKKRLRCRERKRERENAAKKLRQQQNTFI